MKKELSINCGRQHRFEEMGKSRRTGVFVSKKVRVIVTLLVCSAFVFAPLSSYGQQAKVKDVLITKDAGRVLVYAMVTDCFTQEMEAAIRAGVPTMFAFLIDLFEERSNWFDQRISHIIVHHTLKYDNVKNIFYVYSDDRQSAGFPDLESAKRAMAELNGVPIIPVKSLQKGRTYYIRIKAKLDKVRLPMHMEYVLFFASLWDFDTEWIQKGLPVKYDEKP
jgi:hypothetical protein